MPAGIGYGFDPSAGINNQNGQGGDTQGVSRLSPQQAVKLLSLRIPERAAPTAIAPQALLQSKGAAGMGGGMNALIQGLMRAFAPGMQSGEGVAPTPRTIPGLEDPGGFQGPLVDPTQPDPNAVAALRARMGGNTGIVGGTNFDPNSPRFNPGLSGPPAGPTIPPYLQQKMSRQDMNEPLF